MSEVIIDKVKFKNVPDKRYGTKVNDILTQSNIGISADVAAYIQSQDFYTLVNGIDIDWNGIEVEDGLVLNTTADLINWIKTNGGGSAVEQIQSDWNQQDSTKKDFIKNKPTIPTPIDAYTKTEVNTLLDGKIDTTLKGAKNGVASLDSTGKVPASQLPSYVDEVGASQNVSDHDKQWQTQNNLQSFFDKENEKVYVVPFFYCTTPIKTSVVREFESTAEELIKDDDLRNVAYGWGGNYHLNALGHAQCAYQLYGWIKWTLASL